jgi:predicted phosphodiesterase
MTRWAFVSDIHGNRPALEAVEHLARERGAQHFVCLGDVIGKGDPAGCVAWVRDHADLAIVGNRDLDYLDRVGPELQTIVRSWGNEALASDFIASHGEPRLHRALNSAAERDGFQRAQAYMTARGVRVWFFGHTHRARAWWLAARGAEALVDESIHFQRDSRYVINVGTTGLPLPGRGPASFVIYDDVEACVERVAVKADAIVRSRPRRSAFVHV